MKEFKLLFVIGILICRLDISIQAQNRSFATLEILCETPFAAYENNLVEVYINHKLAGSLKFKEKLVYKIYSEGRLTLTFKENNFKINQLLDLEHDSTYYFLYGYYKRRDYVKEKDKTKYHNIFLSEKIADEITSNVIQNTFYEEESLQNPFGELPEGISSGPKQGTGFLVADGIVVTNYHVVDGAEEIKVIGVEGDFSVELDASIHSVDIQNDLALLKIDTKLIDFSPIPYKLGNSENLKVGSKAYAMGYPISDVMGQEIKVTDGIINANSGYKGSLSVYQFSAAVQPGNSGGPLFDPNGNVIGIVTSKLNADNTESIGYAVKADYLNLFLKLADVQTRLDSSAEKEMVLTEIVERNSQFVYVVKCE